MKHGKLIVISGPSGAGKDSILKPMLASRADFVESVSITTRLAREGEVDGVDYFFMNPKDFLEAIDAGEFLEHAIYGGCRYGTPKMAIMAHLLAGKNVALTVEVQGAAQIKKALPEAVLIFIKPPCIQELERRIRQRGSETEASLAKRMATAHHEMLQSLNYDYVVTNDNLETAISVVSAIVAAEVEGGSKIA